MTKDRTTLMQFADREARDVLAQCVTAMARLDTELHFTWMNPALAELIGAGMLRWQGASLEVIEPGSSGIVDAARRALADQQVVVLRQVAVRSSADADLIGDIAFTPIGEQHLLLELHPHSATSERGSPLLSESLRGFAHEVKNPLAGVRGAAQLLAPYSSSFMHETR